MIKKVSLNKQDWIDAGFSSLKKGGVQALKIEKIARELKVSKGSFYWHFKNAAALKHAMLEYWEETTTTSIIKEIENFDISPEKQLKQLVNISSSKQRSPIHSNKLDEIAIRCWARFDTQVASAVKKVDGKRIKFLSHLFSQLGNSQKAGLVKAKILYSALIGMDHLSHLDIVKIESDLPDLLTILTDD